MKAIKRGKQLWENREVCWGEKAAESWLQVSVDTPADLSLQRMLLRKLVFLFSVVDFVLDYVYATLHEFKVTVLNSCSLIILCCGTFMSYLRGSQTSLDHGPLSG